jgi:hypothetical protein
VRNRSRQYVRELPVGVLLKRKKPVGVLRTLKKNVRVEMPAFKKKKTPGGVYGHF